MKFCVHSLGCKVNQYEGQSIVRTLKESGHTAVTDMEEADIYIFNTCSVTSEADKKSRQLIAKAVKLNPNAKIYVCGCSSQNDPTPYARKKNVRLITGTAGKSTLMDRITTDILQESKQISVKIDDFPSAYESMRNAGHGRTRASIKIQDGCDNFCSYCIVPYLRGRSRSRDMDSIREEAEEAARTTKELVLTGINLSAYGRDIGVDLTALIRSLAGIGVRKRLGSLECTVIDRALLSAMRDGGFCDHFHLSLQSGSDTVLRRMNRHYTSAVYAEKVDLIRSYFPDAGITTDVIAGFPEETEQEHAQTLRFVETIGFSDMHVFPYSVRAGTAAANKPQIDVLVRNARAAQLTEVKTRLKASYAVSMLGKILPVYYEETKNGLSQGYTTNYLKVYAPTAAHTVRETRLTEIFSEGVKGEPI